MASEYGSKHKSGPGKSPVGGSIQGDTMEFRAEKLTIITVVQHVVTHAVITPQNSIG